MTATLRLLLILPTAVISAISLTALAPACAGTVYKWTDSNGVVHYTDRAPPQAGQEAAAVERIRYAAEPKPLARMALDTGDGQYRAIARNLIHGHIEVELRYRENRNIDSRPPLPTRHVLPGLARRPAVRFAWALPRPPWPNCFRPTAARPAASRST